MVLSTTTIFVSTLVLIVAIATHFFIKYINYHYFSFTQLKNLGKSRENGQKGKHAVVMGGSLAGIFAARVLLDHFERVTIVEYGEYNKESRIRSTVPQGAHSHILLSIAALTYGKLFKNLEKSIREKGAYVTSMSDTLIMLQWGKYRALGGPHQPFWSMSRPFLEKAVRDAFYDEYKDRVDFQFQRRIVAPVLSTELPDILTRKEKGDSIHITGEYSGAKKIDINSGEFRLVGIRVKRRSAKDKSDINDPTADTKTIKTSNVEDVPSELFCHSPISDTHMWDEHDEEYVLGDLVVDCTGSNSISSKWAKNLWKLDVPSCQIKVGTSYASLYFKEPEGFEADWSCIVVYPTPGRGNIFGYLMRVENGYWQLTGMANGKGKVDHDSVEEFINFFSKIEDPLIYKHLTTPCPTTGKLPTPVPGEKINTYVPSPYLRNFFDMCPHWPEGFIAFGNAACTFDPVYGQGMSGVAIAAITLNNTLSQKAYQGPSGVYANGLAQSYHKLLHTRLDIPWLICLSEDLRWSTTQAEGVYTKNTGIISTVQFLLKHIMIASQDSKECSALLMYMMNMTGDATTACSLELTYYIIRNMVLTKLGIMESPEAKFDRKHKALLEGDTSAIKPVFDPQEVNNNSRSPYYTGTVFFGEDHYEKFESKKVD